MARYIDADIVSEEIDKLQDNLQSNNDVIWRKNKPIYKGLCYARGIINEIPTADVVPKREGKWEKRIFIIFDSEKVGYRCSVCNTTWDTETNFCPYCGAHMSGGKE